MIKRMKKARSDERGFTLVELMVVVLVIGGLMAIAIPTFMGVRARSQDTSAKSSLRNSMTSAATIYTDSSSYDDANSKALAVAEPSIKFVDAPKTSNGSNTVSVRAKGDWGGAALSESGKCFFVLVKASGQTTYGSNDKAKCAGDQAAKYAKDTQW
ncbi:MAG: prepilin-type N-terminal cleavage/methylation domain-containing protein [Microthrixaceae bacterium]